MMLRSCALVVLSRGGAVRRSPTLPDRVRRARGVYAIAPACSWRTRCNLLWRERCVRVDIVDIARETRDATWI